MIQDYSDPIVTLNQVYKATSVGANPVLGACIIGPNYIVKTYEDLGKALQLDSDQNYPKEYGNEFSPDKGLEERPYPGLQAYEGAVDKNTVRVLVKSAVIQYRAFDGTDAFTVQDNDTLSITQTLVPAAQGQDAQTEEVVFYGTYADASQVPFTVGDKVLITFTDETTCQAVIKGFIKGDNAKYTKCVLSRSLPDTAIASISFCKVMDVYVNTSDVTSTSTNIGVSAAAATTLDLGVGQVEYSVLSGTFYAQYRVLSTRFIGKEGMVASPDDVQAVLGKVCEENPLALAVACAAAQADNNFVYFTAVDPASVENADDVTVASVYAQAAEVFADKDGRYGIVPCTEVKAVHQSLFAFVQAQSSQEIPYFKYLYAALQIPKSVTLAQDLKLYATNAISYDQNTKYTAVKFEKSPLLDIPAVVRGDKLVFGDKSLVVDKTNYKDTVYIVGNYSADLSGTSAFSLQHYFKSNDQIVDYLTQNKAISDRRCSYVFADGARYKGIAVPNYCVAAALAGLRSSSLPHAPLSNVPVASLTTDQTHQFTASQSKRLGAYGFWRVGQNEDGIVISRRQLTSAASGDPNYDEQSIVCDVDHICLSLKTAGRNLVGNSNITGQLLDLLQAQLRVRLSAFTQAQDVYIGPQLLTFQLQAPEQDPVHKDRVYASFGGQPPKPFNRFHMTFYMK